MGKLDGRVALVAGATRGAGRGIAVALGEEGATVYCAGRSSRADEGRGARKGDPFDLARRPETIEETAERIPKGVPVRADLTKPAEVEAVVARIEREQGRLDVLVNDVWGGDHLVDFGKAAWELDPEKGFEMIDRVLRTHVLVTRHALPLMLRGGSGLVVEVTDGDFVGYRGHQLYDLAKMIPIRLAFGLARDLEARGIAGVTSLALTPGFLRSEAVLDHFGVTEATWRDAVANDPHFAFSESPLYVGRAVAALAADPEVAKKSGRVHASWSLAKEYGFTDADGTRPDFAAHFDSTVAALAAKGDLTPDERFLVQARYHHLMLDPSRRALTEPLARALGFPPPHSS